MEKTHYTSKDGKTLTYYEWQEENGLLSANDEYRLEAGKNGTFPHVYLLNPTNKAAALIENENRTYGQDNKENYTYLKTSVDGPIAGE